MYNMAVRLTINLQYMYIYTNCEKEYVLRMDLPMSCFENGFANVMIFFLLRYILV